MWWCGLTGAAELGGARVRAGGPRRQRAPRAALARAHALAALPAGTPLYITSHIQTRDLFTRSFTNV